MRIADFIKFAGDIAEYGLSRLPLGRYGHYAEGVERCNVRTMMSAVARLSPDDVDSMVIALRVRGRDGKLGEVQISCGGQPQQRAMLAVALLSHVHEQTDPTYFDLDALAAVPTLLHRVSNEIRESDRFFNGLSAQNPAGLTEAIKIATGFDLKDHEQEFKIYRYEGDWSTSDLEMKPAFYRVH